MLGGGQIVSFYSYKGGAGRTMAVANVGCILANNGYKVLLIDWDLESPGLHRYFSPFLGDPDLKATAGVIDFARAAAERSQISLLECAVPIKMPLSGGGSIEFVSAGRQDEQFQRRVNTFDWNMFYERGGNDLIASERQRLKSRYDYVLIDSRTGVTDSSGICTTKLPDMLVTHFTLNHQSIEGTAGIVARAKSQRSDLKVFPVPARVEYGEHDKLSTAIAFARRVFAPFLIHVQSNRSAIEPTEQIRYWREVETPYVAYYAFEEIPAVFKEEPGSRRGILAANERLASWMTGQDVSSLKFAASDNRQAILEAFGFNQRRAFTFDSMGPARKSLLLGTLQSLERWLLRHRWQLATAILATVVVVMLGLPVYKNFVKSPNTPGAINQPASSKIDAPSQRQDSGTEPPKPRQSKAPE
jgi:MinD-like ATPase involved in chromosome partitioning or flagellar assembly